MKKRTKKKTPMASENRMLLLLALLGVLCLTIAVVIACIQATPITDYTAAIRELGYTLFFCGMGMLGAVFLAIFLSLIIRYTDFEAVRSTAHRIGISLSNYMLVNNAESYSYRLKFFLFDVLRRNNEVLHIPLGEDFTCLTPRELSYACREGCVFYRFDLVAPQAPETDIATLRKIVQSYIDGELYHYGIVGLRSVFCSKAMGVNLGSVYLDRITYDNTRHRLTFDVLYVCSEKAAEYVAKAIKRDAAKVQLEREIFDDELQ